MTTKSRKNRQRSGEPQPVGLRGAVEVLRQRFSSIRIQATIADCGTALSVQFLGDGTNLEERQLLAATLAKFVEPAFYIIGIKPEQNKKTSEMVEGGGEPDIA